MNKHLKYILAICALSLAAVNPVRATVVINPGDSVIFDFDFSGASPPPPYSQVTVETFLIGPTTVRLDLFTELAGGGSLALFVTSPVSGPLDVIDSDSGIIDGIFSVKITDTGTIAMEVQSIDAKGSIAGDGTATITPTVSGTGTAPEPATLALLGIALAGLGFSRRQRN